MNIDRRSGALSTFTWLLGLTLGATCAAMTPACSASSGSASPGGWGQSGGGPLGADTTSSGSGSGDDAASWSTPPIGNGDAAPGSPVGSGDDAAAAGGEGGVIDIDAAADAPSEAAPAVPDFTLIDTTVTTVVNGSPVTGYDPIATGATINLATVGSALSIRANTIPALVGSVAFALDATYTHTEDTAPYMLCSDNGAGVVTSCASVLTVGLHTLTATPYSATNLGGDAGAPISLTFTIVDVDAGATDGGAKDAAGQ
ncbi:MAG TPA: hypothetical protein VGL81_28510 [Polyangiaceae bacterium]|jgi:hypothetical protein